MTTLTTDEAHVLSDALWALTREIEHGARPWTDYTTDPADDPKADRTGHARVMSSAASKLIRLREET